MFDMSQTSDLGARASGAWYVGGRTSVSAARPTSFGPLVSCRHVAITRPGNPRSKTSPSRGD